MMAGPRALNREGFFPNGRSRCGKCSLLPHLCQLLSVQRSSSVVVAIENPSEERPGWSSQPQVAGCGPGVFGDTTQRRIFQAKCLGKWNQDCQKKGSLAGEKGRGGWVASF